MLPALFSPTTPASARSRRRDDGGRHDGGDACGVDAFLVVVFGWKLFVAGPGTSGSMSRRVPWVDGLGDGRLREGRGLLAALRGQLRAALRWLILIVAATSASAATTRRRRPPRLPPPPPSRGLSSKGARAFAHRFVAVVEVDHEDSFPLLRRRHGGRLGWILEEGAFGATASRVSSSGVSTSTESGSIAAPMSSALPRRRGFPGVLRDLWLLMAFVSTFLMR